MSALTPSIDFKPDVAACPCCCCPMPLLVFRRLDIHLAGKDENDVTDDRFLSFLLDGSSIRICRSGDMSESIIGGASVGSV